MTDKKKDKDSPEENTTDTNAGPDADFGDGKYHDVPAPTRPRGYEE